MFVQYIFKKLNIVLIILKIDEDQDLDYDVVRITNIGFVDPYGNEGLIVLRDDDNKEFHMRAFSGEVSNHIASFIDGENELSYEFSSFINENEFIFPKRFSISVRSSENFEATLDYSKIVFNEKQKLSFKIPSSYAESE